LANVTVNSWLEGENSFLLFLRAVDLSQWIMADIFLAH